MPCQAEIFNESDLDLTELIDIANEFLPRAQEVMGFSEPVTVSLISDEENSINPLGKTAYYDPMEKAISLFVDGRHTKDILRSLSHELVHHTQNCNGMFDDIGAMGPGYAQEDDHLREMEREAYELGNMCFRDWEDEYKKKQEWQLNENRVVDALKRMWGNRGAYVDRAAQALGNRMISPDHKQWMAGQRGEELQQPKSGRRGPLAGFFSATEAGLLDTPSERERLPHFSEEEPGPYWDCRPIPAKLGQSFDPYAWRGSAAARGQSGAINEGPFEDRMRGEAEARRAEDDAEDETASDAAEQSNCPEGVDRRDTINNWINWIFMHDGDDVKKAFYSVVYDRDVGSRRKMDIYGKYAEVIDRGEQEAPDGMPTPEDVVAPPADAVPEATPVEPTIDEPNPFAPSDDAIAPAAEPEIAYPDIEQIKKWDQETAAWEQRAAEAPVYGSAEDAWAAHEASEQIPRKGVRGLAKDAIGTAVKEVYGKASGRARDVNAEILIDTLLFWLQRSYGQRHKTGQIFYDNFQYDLIKNDALQGIEPENQKKVAKELAIALKELSPSSNFETPIDFWGGDFDDRIEETLTFSEELRIRSAVQSAMGKIEEKAKARWSKKNITLKEANRFAKLAGIKLNKKVKLTLQEGLWDIVTGEQDIVDGYAVPWSSRVDLTSPEAYHLDHAADTAEAGWDAWSDAVTTDPLTIGAGHVADVATAFGDTNYSETARQDMVGQYASERARDQGRTGATDEDYAAATLAAQPYTADAMDLWDAGVSEVGENWDQIVTQYAALADLPGQADFGPVDQAWTLLNRAYMRGWSDLNAMAGSGGADKWIADVLTPKGLEATPESVWNPETGQWDRTGRMQTWWDRELLDQRSIDTMFDRDQRLANEQRFWEGEIAGLERRMESTAGDCLSAMRSHQDTAGSMRGWTGCGEDGRGEMQYYDLADLQQIRAPNAAGGTTTMDGFLGVEGMGGHGDLIANMGIDMEERRDEDGRIGLYDDEMWRLMNAKLRMGQRAGQRLDNMVASLGLVDPVTGEQITARDPNAHDPMFGASYTLMDEWDDLKYYGYGYQDGGSLLGDALTLFKGYTGLAAVQEPLEAVIDIPGGTIQGLYSLFGGEGTWTDVPALSDMLLSPFGATYRGNYWTDDVPMPGFEADSPHLPGAPNQQYPNYMPGGFWTGLKHVISPDVQAQMDAMPVEQRLDYFFKEFARGADLEPMDDQDFARIGADYAGENYVPEHGAMQLEDRLDSAYNNIDLESFETERLDESWYNSIFSDDASSGGCLNFNSTGFGGASGAETDDRGRPFSHNIVQGTGGETVCGVDNILSRMMQQERDISFISHGTHGGDTPSTEAAQNSVRVGFIRNMKAFEDYSQIRDNLGASLAVDTGLFAQTREHFGIGRVDNETIEEFFSPRADTESLGEIEQMLVSTGRGEELTDQQRQILRRVLDEAEAQEPEQFEQDVATLMGYETVEEAQAAVGRVTMKDALWQMISIPAMSESEQMADVERVFANAHSSMKGATGSGVEQWLVDAGYEWAEGGSIQAEDFESHRPGSLANRIVVGPDGTQVPVLVALNNLSPWDQHRDMVSRIMMTRTLDIDRNLMSTAEPRFAMVEELYSANLILSQQADIIRARLAGGEERGITYGFGQTATADPLPFAGQPDAEHRACMLTAREQGTDPTQVGCVFVTNNQDGTPQYRLYDDDLIRGQEWPDDSFESRYYEYLDESDYGTIRQLESLVVSAPAVGQGNLIGSFPSLEPGSVDPELYQEQSFSIGSYLEREEDPWSAGPAVIQTHIRGAQAQYGWGFEYLKAFQYNDQTPDGQRDELIGAAYHNAMLEYGGDGSQGQEVEISLLRTVFGAQEQEPGAGEGQPDQTTGLGGPDTTYEVIMTLANPGLILEQDEATGAWTERDPDEYSMLELAQYHARVRDAGIRALQADGLITAEQAADALSRFGNPDRYIALQRYGIEPGTEYTEPAEFVSWFENALATNAQSASPARHQAIYAYESFGRSQAIVERLAWNSSLKSSLSMDTEQHYGLFMNAETPGRHVDYGTGLGQDEYYLQFQDDPRYRTPHEDWMRLLNMNRRSSAAGSFASKEEHSAYLFAHMWLTPEEGGRATEASRAWMMRYAPEIVYRYYQAQDNRDRTLTQGMAHAASVTPGMDADDVHAPISPTYVSAADRFMDDVRAAVPETAQAAVSQAPAASSGTSQTSDPRIQPLEPATGLHGPESLSDIRATSGAYIRRQGAIGFNINGHVVRVGQILSPQDFTRDLRRSLRRQGVVDYATTFPNGLIVIDQPQARFQANRYLTDNHIDLGEGVAGDEALSSNKLDTALDNWRATMERNADVWPLLDTAGSGMPAVAIPVTDAQGRATGEYYIHYYGDSQQSIQENVGRIRQIKDIELIKEQIRKAFSDKRINLPRKKLEEIIRKQIITSLQGDK